MRSFFFGPAAPGVLPRALLLSAPPADVKTKSGRAAAVAGGFRRVVSSNAGRAAQRSLVQSQRIPMATNAPIGEGHPNGAVCERSQLKTKVVDEPFCAAKRSASSRRKRRKANSGACGRKLSTDKCEHSSPVQALLFTLLDMSHSPFGAQIDPAGSPNPGGVYLGISCLSVIYPLSRPPGLWSCIRTSPAKEALDGTDLLQPRPSVRSTGTAPADVVSHGFLFHHSRLVCRAPGGSIQRLSFTSS